MAESTAHIDTFVRDNLPPPEAWPTLTLASLPELAAIGPRVNCATALLDAQAAARPEASAIISGDQVWSYGDLAEKANRIANVLAEDLGVVPGGRVFMRLSAVFEQRSCRPACHRQVRLCWRSASPSLLA